MPQHGTIIVATDLNWLIGNRPNLNHPGETPWQGQQRGDMIYFREQTNQKRVLMTRPTYESIPEQFRPLKDREVAILTRQNGYTQPGCDTVHSLDEGFQWAGGRELMIAGGGQLYWEAIFDVRVNRILRTLIQGTHKGNIYFPSLSAPEWKMKSANPHPADAKNAHGYVFEEYVWGIQTVDDIPLPPEGFQVVNPRNARSSRYLRELLEIQRSGQCPFCAGGKTLLEDPIIAQNELCWMKHSHTPYKNAQLHLVLAPMAHRLSEREITPAEDAAMKDMLYGYLEEQNIPANGVTFTREGPEAGNTVMHIHRNFVVPEDGKIVTANFGRWSGALDWLAR